jgi:predicted ATPase/DNA-binding SARP family transcriptional activator
VEPRDATIEIRLLGPVELRVDGRDAPIGGARQRALLALLGMRPGQVIAADELIDELWSGEPTDGADTTLRSYVSKLRAASNGSAVIRRAGRGYLLDVPVHAVDVHVFERLVRSGSETLARGSARRARAQLAGALDLWRGRPFGEVGTDGFLGAAAERLDGLRALAVERRIEADLALGRSAELVDELEGLIRDHPFRERLWQHLMLALYRAGRQADALAAYHRARAALDEQLGIEPSEELRDLEAAILRQEVPPPAEARDRHDLPEPLTNFVGREAEIAAIGGLLDTARLVTLTGVGGVGKTRLAIETARQLADRWADGVLFVDLSATMDPDLVARQVAGALDVSEQPGIGPIEALAAHLRERELLLVLDNCEHLAGACAEVAHEILTRCARVQVLATSRVLLGVPGEVDAAVEPLGLPTRGAPIATVRASDAVRLFIARAREVRRGLADDETSIARVAEICRDLDGLPLAIELAAARALTLSLDDIADRVHERFRFLVSWRRLTTSRHRTLRQAIDWSFDLLSPDEQRVLTRISAFVGGFTLSAVVAVGIDGDEAEALGVLDRLVASSLVSVVNGPGETRYRMLDTVRQYAEERLDASGAGDAVRRRHAEHFQALLDAAWAPLRLGDAASWTDRLAAELDNVRAALAWARDAGDREAFLRLAVGMAFFWWIHGDLAEGRSWMAAALQGAAGLDPTLRAQALNGAARLAWAATDLDPALDLAQQAWAALPEDAPALEKGIILQTLGVISTARQELPSARTWLEQARASYEALAEDDPWRRDRLAGVIIVLGSVDFFEGDYAKATERYREALAMCVARDDRDGIALCELYLGHVALLEGRVPESMALVRSSLTHYRRLGWLQYVAECLEIIGFGAGATGRPEEAARLVGAADAVRDQIGTPATLALLRLRIEGLPVVQAELGEEAYAGALAAGRALSAEQAVVEAIRVATP